MTKPFADEDLSSLLEESFKKIQSGTESDSKKLSDMNNTLNWILTLTTFFFIFYSQHHFDLSCKVDKFISVILKIIFIMSISVLIIHKFLFIKYEDNKGSYLSSLRTHYIDLKFNVDKMRPHIPKTDPLLTINFINAFRNGKLSYHNLRDITIRDFKALDKKINFYGNGIKLTYNLGMVLFVINFIITSYLIFR